MAISTGIGLLAGGLLGAGGAVYSAGQNRKASARATEAYDRSAAPGIGYANMMLPYQERSAMREEDFAQGYGDPYRQAMAEFGMESYLPYRRQAGEYMAGQMGQMPEIPGLPSYEDSIPSNEIWQKAQARAISPYEDLAQAWGERAAGQGMMRSGASEGVLRDVDLAKSGAIRQSAMDQAIQEYEQGKWKYGQDVYQAQWPYQAQEKARAQRMSEMMAYMGLAPSAPQSNMPSVSLPGTPAYPGAPEQPSPGEWGQFGAQIGDVFSNPSAGWTDYGAGAYGRTTPIPGGGGVGQTVDLSQYGGLGALGAMTSDGRIL